MGVNDNFGDYLQYLTKIAAAAFGVDSDVFNNMSGETWKSRRHYDNTKEDKEVWSGKPINRFTPEQRHRLNKLKEVAIDVEYEEV